MNDIDTYLSNSIKNLISENHEMRFKLSQIAINIEAFSPHLAVTEIKRILKGAEHEN